MTERLELILALRETQKAIQERAELTPNEIATSVLERLSK